jgi:hypothetical protein
MKPKLLILNHAYLLFGTTVYVGVLWALHFFWYPSWQVMTLATVQDHFIKPTSAATRFFTVVVPLMFLANFVLIYTERRYKKTLIPAIVALAGVSTASYVGQVHIIPINKRIAAGLSDSDQLIGLLKQWMFLNDIRWVVMTAMWLAMVYYFVVKGRLLDALADPGQSASQKEGLP